MNNRLHDVLTGHNGNYILPFFWQHGEEESVLREEIARIQESSIGAFCVESRPHPDFCGPRWWHDMDIIMDEARKRSMRVWVLDDRAFPTGSANHWIRDKYPELARIFLAERHMDVVGPQPGASILLSRWLKEGDRIVAVLACRRVDYAGAVDGNPVDLSARIAGDLLHWDIPAGYWRIFFIVETVHDGGWKDFINPLDPKSCRVLIDAVYETHYQRYGADFGKTFAGFFSDEPFMGNSTGYYDCSIGRKRMVLPWRRDLLPLLDAQFGAPSLLALPGLWHDIGARTWSVRYAFMELVTRLYGESFCNQLGAWCEKHGVEYIGHIVEDNGAHARLGMSAGHFFRSMWGQHMSGLDVVLWQLRPGFDRHRFISAGEFGDGEFYHYELGKLGASLGHIDPKKKGRTICEVYGAYGWAEGVRLMKWITDHMLVRGVNWFVPHAFSPREFPDPDCPPHFFARGHNPQFRYFRVLMEYANRICHLLNGGRHVASAAVLYHAEMEWSGDYMPVKQPMRVLMQAQFDADIVPADVLCDASVAEGKLEIAAESYPCLIVPWSQRLPRRVLEAVRLHADRGLRIAFVNSLPQGSGEGVDASEVLGYLAHSPHVAIVPLEKLAEQLDAWGMRDVRIGAQEPYLRCYHYMHGKGNIWMYFNEHPAAEVRTTAFVGTGAPLFCYDAFANALCSMESAKDGNTRKFALNLAPGEAMIVTDSSDGTATAGPLLHWSMLNAGAPAAIDTWQISIKAAVPGSEFAHFRDMRELANLCHPSMLPDFSGTIRYEATLQMESKPEGRIWLDLGAVGETAEVWINGHHAGVRISGPYIFDITEVLAQRENRLRIDVTNTLGYRQKDDLSKFHPLDSVGLIGPVMIRTLA